MPFQALKKYIIQQISSSNTEEEQLEYDFSGTFSEVLQKNTNHEEAVVLLMALVPNVLAGFYEEIIQEVFPNGGDLPHFGGTKTEGYRSMIPTGETVQYVLALKDIQHRIRIQEYFNTEHWFFKDNILSLEDVKPDFPPMSGKVILSKEALSKLLFGVEQNPKFSSEFPAQLIATKLNWEDLIINPSTESQLEHLKLRIQYESQLKNIEELRKRTPEGVRVLFYGPSGTGKTLTASLLGKEYNMPVYRIDLSQIVSKYIGETEKNLEKIFSAAENKKWIIFFDEADALFGKRSSNNSSQDRFANQQVSYLLQRIENFNSLAILATNLKTNIDSAFLRRFNYVIHFPKPNLSERIRLWKNAIPENYLIENQEIFEKIVANYELTGAQITNAVIFAMIKTLAKNSLQISTKDILQGIKLEFEKEEKLFKDL